MLAGCKGALDLCSSDRECCNRPCKVFGTERRCDLAYCGELANPPSGSVIYSNITEGSVANYTCDDSYFLNGTESRVCESNGLWSDQEPTCSRMSSIICDVYDNRDVMRLQELFNNCYFSL